MEAGRVGRDAATAEVVVRRRGGIGGAHGGDARHIVASEGDIGGESVGADGETGERIELVLFQFGGFVGQCATSGDEKLLVGEQAAAVGGEAVVHRDPEIGGEAEGT